MVGVSNGRRKNTREEKKKIRAKKGRTPKQKELWEDIRKWVEKNGIYPQRCGATITKFLQQFPIDRETYRDWLEDEKNTEFSEMIKRANEVFAQRFGELMENALVKLVTGFEDWEEMQEGIPDGKGGVIIKKMIRKKKIVPTNLGAITYLQCNMFPNRWTNPLKIEADMKGSIELVKGMTPDEAKRYLEKMNSIESE